MFSSLLRLFQRKKINEVTAQVAGNFDSQLREAHSLYANGKVREALPVLQHLVALRPDSADSHNLLGVCYSDVGDTASAVRHFEMAYALDDMQPTNVANHATSLIELGQFGEARQCLAQLAVLNPEFNHLYAVYARLSNLLGDAQSARRSSLHAWLGHFRNTRTANSYLFNSTYACTSEQALAQEHRFWADTLILPAELPPLPVADVTGVENFFESTADARVALGGVKKIRIAYWSPDLRSHSVRYFFNPLLKAHDRSKFDVHVLHDTFAYDVHTDFVKAHCDRFHDVYTMTDEDLRAYVQAQRFDILVELAGHTSANRIALLAQRMAPLQITALGYPPTTGLTTVDYKLGDKFTHTDDAHAYYAEKPLVLPTSFWCFDPMESAPMGEEPPAVSAGYITFACVGNLSKISVETLDVWSQILQKVPTSRLQLRSIPFTSGYVKEQYRAKLARAGIPLERVDLLAPLGGEQFFTSYNDIDIVLDTFPFNGGTTTSFAVYMGVPVVSRCGNSLPSRMGLSILSNSGMADLVSSTWQSYVDNAVRLAGDVSRLRQIKRNTRAIMQGNALGNGEMFAREFEQACLDAIDAQGYSPLSMCNAPVVSVLPRKEWMSRAFKVLEAGDQEAALRIHNQAVNLFGQSASTRIFQSVCTPPEVDLEEPAAVQEALVGLDVQDQAELLLYVAHKACMDERMNDAEWAFGLLDSAGLQNPTDRLMHRMLQMQMQMPLEPLPDPAISLHDGNVAAHIGGLAMHANDMPVSLLVVHVSSEPRELVWLSGKSVFNGTDAACQSVKVITVQPTDRWTRVMQESAGYTHTVVINNNVTWDKPLNLASALELLAEQDVVGVAGCRRWQRLKWVHDDAEECVGLVVRASTEAHGRFELANLGTDFPRWMDGLAVLDGSFLIFQSKLLSTVVPPDNDSGLLSDTAWTAACARAGYRLAVSNQIDVILGTPEKWGSAIGQQLAVEALVQSYGFDLIEEGLDEKRHHPSVICSGFEQAVLLRQRLLKTETLGEKT